MLIVGLGNPGKEYANTHHNVGFMFADRVAEAYKVDFKLSKKFQCYIGEFQENGSKHYLIKPTTYMNNSGIAVSAVANYYNIPLNEIFITYDDMDLPLGEIRIRKFGSAGGHNGMKSIINSLGSQEFARYRIGIGRSKSDNKEEVIDYVLSNFSKSDMDILNKTLDLSANIVVDLINHNVDYIMNNYNN